MSYLAVAIGGFVGACARYAIGEWMGTVHGFPMATLLINILGSFVLAWFYTFTVERMPIHPHIRLGIGTGLIGAFTTFSTFTVEAWSLVTSGLYAYALIYLATTVVLGLTAAALGYWTAMRQSRLRWDEQVGKEA